jgi:glycosyltransferase involved in cell wall biosynthesis
MTRTDHSHATLSILMPAYNERAYLRKCVERVLAAPLPDGLNRELIIVDDASTDGTTDLVRELAAQHPDRIRAFFQDRNQGKGAAIRRAIQEMKGQYAIFQDSDLEYDPNEYSKVLEPLLKGYADVVYGSRFASSPMRRVLNYHHQIGNLILTHASNFLTGLNLTDMETCYKAFNADILKTIPIRCDRFGIEPEITAKIAKRNCIVYEVPISYHGRTYGEGKKIGWKDGFSALHKIIKFWLLDDCIDERYGHDVLDSLLDARHFNRWLADVINPYLGNCILEVGSGIGTVTRVLPKRERLTVTDMDPVYLELLESAYADHDLVDVQKLDLTSDADVAALAGRAYDTVVCLNVLEHIEDDLSALKRMNTLLAPGGRLVLVVPQYPKLYGSYDKHLRHFRRYHRADAERLLASAGYTVEKSFNFNVLAIPAWWINSCLLKRESMGRYQIKIFDMLVPLLKPLEALFPLPGLSLVCIARKTAASPESA